VTDVFLSFQRWTTFAPAQLTPGCMMELQQLLLGRDYLQRAAAASPRTAGYLASSDLATASVDTADAVLSADRTRSCSVVAGLAVDCRRSSLHDVLFFQRHRQRQHPESVSAMMQYPPSQHPLPAAAAAAAIGLGSAGSSPYCSPYYQRSSSSHHYLAPTHGFPDSSRHNLDSFATSMQPGFSYQQQAALLRDTATRLAVADGAESMTELTSPARNDAASRLGVDITNYCADRRCGPACLTDCFPVAGPLSLPSSRYYMPGGRLSSQHLQSNTSTTSHTGAGGGAFMRYLRPPVNVSIDSYSADCVCQWLDPTSIAQRVKLKVSIHRKERLLNPLWLYIKTAEQRTIIQRYGDWYTGR